MDSINEPLGDFFDHDPSKAEKVEMRKDSKSPSEWLKLLCRDWAAENMEIAEGTDLKFLGYKSYLKGKLSSQLLCRLSIPELGRNGEDDTYTSSIDFWKILGIQDEFDIRHIISQIEKFCSLYSIRSTVAEDEILDGTLDDHTAVAAVAAAGFAVSPLDNFLTAGMDMGKQPSPVSRREPRRLPISHKNNMNGKRSAPDRTVREVTREEKRQKKMFQRHQREKIAKEQKQAALKRAAELVRSNRIPIEITRGASLPKAVKRVVCLKDNNNDDLKKGKRRSDIVVSTASDLDQIVTHAKNLWLKYNAIAKEHNQKISWAMISKELGLHVKVREKYARMHSRALQRGFDFKKYGSYKIKDHPEIFLEPIPKKQSMDAHDEQPEPTEATAIELNNIEPNTILNHSPIPEESNLPLAHHDVHTPSAHSSDIHTIHSHAHEHDGTSVPNPTHIIGGHSDHESSSSMSIHHTHNHTETETETLTPDGSLHQHPLPNHHHHHDSHIPVPLYSTREPGGDHHDNGHHVAVAVPVPQITDDQVAAAVDAAIKTVPANHSTDFGAEAEAAEVALAAGPAPPHPHAHAHVHIGNMNVNVNVNINDASVAVSTPSPATEV